MRTFAFLPFAFVCAIALTGCKSAPPANVAATVNSRPITYADVDKHFQLNFADAQSRPADDQMTIQKLEIVRTLIDNEIMLQRAEKLSLMATDADVEAKFNELKSGYTQEEFQKTLDARKMTVADLKAQTAQGPERPKTDQQGNHIADLDQRQSRSPSSTTPTKKPSIWPSRRFTSLRLSSPRTAIPTFET